MRKKTVALTFVTPGELIKWTPSATEAHNLNTIRTSLTVIVVLPYDQRVATR